MIHKEEAIVLRTVDYSNTSQIVCFYTREMGKISAIAKGVRKSKPSRKYSGPLEVLSHIDAVFYQKPGGSLASIQEYDTHNYFYGMRKNLRQLCSGLYIAEFVYEFTQDQDPQPELFTAMESALENLAQGTNWDGVRFFFVIFSLSLLGMAPQLRNCLHCRQPVLGVMPAAFSVEKSGIFCYACRSHIGGPSLKLSRDCLAYLQKLTTVTVRNSAQLEVLPVVKNDMEILLRYYLRFLLQKELRMSRYLK